MFKDATLLSFYTEQGMHVGGETTLTFVDKPIQREKYTDIPFIRNSGIKGAIREWFETNYLYLKLVVESKELTKDELHKISKSFWGNVDNSDLEQEKIQEELNKIITVFGPENDGSAHSGAVSFTDARLLLFPVKSVKGVFAYITCPMLLNRFRRDITSIAQGEILNWETPIVTSFNCCVKNDSNLKIDGKILLEEYPFNIQTTETEKLDAISTFIKEKLVPRGDEYEFYREKVEKDIVVLSDDDFRDFVLHSTEIQTRIKLGQGKSTDTNKGGNLFTVENLLPDTLFYTLLYTNNPSSPAEFTHEEVNTSKKIMEYIKKLDNKRMQIGGDETLGKGIVKVKFL